MREATASFGDKVVGRKHATAASRLAEAAMPPAYRWTKIAIMLLLVFPAAMAAMFGIAILHISMYGRDGPKLIGLVPATACLFGFFGALMVGMALANFIPAPRAWQTLWDRTSIQAGGITLREMSRRTLRPFILGGLALLVLSIALGLIPGAW